MPDFRVGFLGFETGGARIAVSAKKPSYFVQNVMVEPSSSNPFAESVCRFNSFYSAIVGTFTANYLGDLGKGKEMSKFIPAHTDNPNFDVTQDSALPGGEFVVPLDQELYFWVRVPGSYRKVGAYISDAKIGTPSFESGGGSLEDFSQYMQLEFGTQVPTAAALEQNGSSYNYSFFLPLFRVKVTKSGVELKNYDFGDCVYVSTDFDQNSGYLEFGDSSSFFD